MTFLLIGCDNHKCNLIGLNSDALTKKSVEQHCDLITAPVIISDNQKLMIYDYESTKDKMSFNSFKSSFEQIFTEDENKWNPTDALELSDPTYLILGLISESGAIGIKYVKGGIRCCDTVFQIYYIQENRIVDHKQIRY